MPNVALEYFMKRSNVKPSEAGPRVTFTDLLRQAKANNQTACFYQKACFYRRLVSLTIDLEVMMSVSKCSSLIFATVVVVVLLPAITLAQSTDYRFEADSTYAFNAGFPGAFLFDISGTFTLNENASFATITDATLVLTPDPSIIFDLDVPLTSAAGVADLLESDLFSLATSAPGQTVYQSMFVENISSLDEPLSITVDNLSANRLVTFSGVGTTFPYPNVADGTSFVFSATAVAVPEPTGLPVCLLLAITFTARRGRVRSLPQF